jgi:hypothetical protein
MEVTLDDLLFNRKQEPYTLRALFAYLDTQLATEILDFWLSAADVRNMFEPDHPRSSYSMNRWHVQETEDVEVDTRRVTPSIRMKLDTLTKTMQEMKKRHAESQILMKTTYIDDDAPLCINISERMRSKIINRCPKTSEDPPCPGLFDDAMTECERLIETNYLSKFLELARKHEKERSNHLHVPVPPPRPRDSIVFKGKELSFEDIQAILPKEPPPPQPLE